MNEHPYVCPLTLVLLSALSINTGSSLADEIVEAAGVKGGLVIHLGCGDGRLTAELRAGERYLVQGLDTDAGNVSRARQHLKSLGIHGKVTADAFDGKRLPYTDNLVNLLVVSDPYDVARDEMLRVLAPRGVALIARAGDQGPGAGDLSSGVSAGEIEIGGKAWWKRVKPWPDEIDEWTHFLHDATGNAVAHDRLVAAPKRLQWIGGPLWSRSHEYDSSLCALVSAHGRLFYIFDEGPTGIIDPRIPDRWTLIARDAFNGVVLWKRRIPDWGWKAWKRAEMEQLDWRRMPSQRARLPVAVPRRLVAAGDRVYVTLGYQAPLTALDAATGRTLMTYAGTERTDEIVHQNGLLVLCIRPFVERPELPAGKKTPGRQEAGPGILVALEAGTGRRLWQTPPGAVLPLSLALSGTNVLYHDRDAAVCLDASSGKQRWRTPTGGAAGSVWNTDTTLVVHQGIVLCATRKQLVGLSAADGKVLWKLPGARGFGVANPPDLFVADDLVWYGRESPEAPSITGYLPLSGEPARTVDLGGVITRGHHARCYRSKATDNYLLLPKRAVEFIDLKGRRHSRHNWLRAACRYGVLPCNGLLYSTPHPCFCYAGVKLNGFLAMAPESEQGRRTGGEQTQVVRLERGPAFNLPIDLQSSISNPQSSIPNHQSSISNLQSPISNLQSPISNLQSPISNHQSHAWPMYRHDPKRSGSTTTMVEPQVGPVWKTPLGGKLTQPVVVGRRLFVARIDAAQVCCLDAVTGQPIWDYLTGGRIDSAPTYYQGRLIFGSADGWVYCLRASDGALAWRFRAAPDERRVVVFGQVESAWPVHGSVLVTNDVAYFAAGRSAFLDGGMVLYGLDPLTGKKRYETRLDGPHPDTSLLDENAYAMEGAKTDLLVTDGTLIYLLHNAFDRRLQKQPTPVKGKPGVRNLGVRDFGEHLFSNAGFLDDSWFNRSYWMVGDRWPAFNFAHQSPKAGQLVVFDETSTYAVKCFVRRNLLSPQFFPATDGYYLVADRNDARPVLVSGDGKGGPDYMRWLPQAGELQTCWNLGVGFARSEPAQWVNNLPVRFRAMVRTGNLLFAAGPPDVCDPHDPTGALEGRKGGVLMAFKPEDGSKRFECKLEAPPVFDGLSAAHGRLFLSTTDGNVICMGSPPPGGAPASDAS